MERAPDSLSASPDVIQTPSGAHGEVAAPGLGSLIGTWTRLRRWCHTHHCTQRDLRFLGYSLAIVLMSVADLKMTLFYVTSVGMTEVNPIARFLMVYGGVCSIVLWKAATVACGVFILWRIRRHRVAEVGAWICCAVLAALCVHWFRYNDQVTTLATEVMHLHDTRNGTDWVVVDGSKGE